MKYIELPLLRWLILFFVSLIHDKTNSKNVNGFSLDEVEYQPKNDQIEDGKVGFFTYDPNDLRYGPGKPYMDPKTQKLRYPRSQWPFVQSSFEQMYWSRKYGDILNTTKDWRNECSWNGRQSPIDVCDDKVNKKCQEHHQTRTRPGDFSLNDIGFLTAQILPSKLRLDFLRRPSWILEPDLPHADFADGWGGFIDVSHIDVKIPSEHTICGKRYVGEYSIYFLHPTRKQRIVLSVMIDLYPSSPTKDTRLMKKNLHFQRLIDKWQKIFDKQWSKCDDGGNKREIILKEGTSNTTYDQSMKEEEEQQHYQKHFSKPWSPFHEDIIRTIYFYGYWGSLTEPPCSDEVTYRILLEPLYISKQQLLQLQNILFNQVDDQCRRTSVQYRGSVARPLQDQTNRPMWKCTNKNFKQDPN